MAFRDYMQLIRVHTANVTISMVFLALILSGVPVIRCWHVYAMWFVFGLFLHMHCFVQNNLFDYKHDVMNERKQHFPLVTGKISYRRAEAIMIGSFTVSLLIAIYAQSKDIANLGLSSFIVLICFATVYNMGSKAWFVTHVGVWIAEPLAFVTVALFYGLEPNKILAVFLFGVVWSLFQNSVVGALKDYGSDPIKNPFVDGTERSDRWRMRAKMLFGLSFSYLAFNFLSFESWHSFAIVLIGAAGMTYYFEMIHENYMATVIRKEGKMDTRKAAIGEIAIFSIFMLVVLPYPKWIWFPAVMMANIMWFMALNRITWGTWLQPKV